MSMKSLTAKKWLGLAAVLCLAMMFVATSAIAAEKIEVKFSHVVADATPKGQASLKFKEILDKSGIFDVKVYPSSQLYGDKEELEALRANNVQVIAPSMTKLVGFNPQFQIVDMPFLFASDDAVAAFWKSEKGKTLFNSVRRAGFMGIAHWPNGFTQFINSKRPLKKPADFKGLKLRVQSGGLLDARNKALGAGSQTMAFAEVYQALNSHAIDGLDNTFNNHETQKFYEVAKYLTIGNFTRIDYSVLTNVKFWDSLKPDQQKIFMAAMDEATEYERKLSMEMDRKSFEIMKNSGKLEIYTLTPAERQEFIKALNPLYKQYEKKIGKDNMDYAMSLK
jgi:C4-dicarboxylate-binding protein DctP